MTLEGPNTTQEPIEKLIERFSPHEMEYIISMLKEELKKKVFSSLDNAPDVLIDEQGKINPNTEEGREIKEDIEECETIDEVRLGFVENNIDLNVDKLIREIHEKYEADNKRILDIVTSKTKKKN